MIECQGRRSLDRSWVRRPLSREVADVRPEGFVPSDSYSIIPPNLENIIQSSTDSLLQHGNGARSIDCYNSAYQVAICFLQYTIFQAREHPRNHDDHFSTNARILRVSFIVLIVESAIFSRRTTEFTTEDPPGPPGPDNRRRDAPQFWCRIEDNAPLRHRLCWGG